MRRLIFLFVTLSAMEAQNAAPPLLDLEKRWAEALQRADTAALDTILSETFVDTSEKGNQTGKRGILAAFKSGDLKLTSIDLSDMQVHAHGDSAIVTGTAAQEGTFQGHPLDPKIVFTDTFVREGGKWMAVASHRSSVAVAATLAMTPAEKHFQESTTNVTMTGFFTVGDTSETHADKYTIGKITKIGEDLWNFDASIKYGDREFKATVKVPVKWAGDTPVITLSNYLIPGQGVYSARILMFNGQYAGAWGAQAHGGKMFGMIVKNQPAP